MAELLLKNEDALSSIDHKKLAILNHVKRVAYQLMHNPAVSALPGGFFAYDAHGTEELIYANDAACAIWGCKDFEELKEFAGGSFRGLLHPEDYEGAEESIWQQIAMDKNGMDRLDYRIIRKDGAVRWVDDYGHLVRNRDCDIFYVFVADTTEKHTRTIETEFC